MLLIAAHPVRACLRTTSIVFEMANAQTALHGITFFANVTILC
jgi:hypothetical protein